MRDEVGMKSVQKRRRTPHRSRNRLTRACSRAAARPWRLRGVPRSRPGGPVRGCTRRRARAVASGDSDALEYGPAASRTRAQTAAPATLLDTAAADGPLTPRIRRRLAYTRRGPSAGPPSTGDPGPAPRCSCVAPAPSSPPPFRCCGTPVTDHFSMPGPCRRPVPARPSVRLHRLDLLGRPRTATTSDFTARIPFISFHTHPTPDRPPQAVIAPTETEIDASVSANTRRAYASVALLPRRVARRASAR